MSYPRYTFKHHE